MLNIKENVDIKNYCTFKIGGRAKYFAVIENIEDLKDILEFSKTNNVPIFILGGGSNIIFPDGNINLLVLKIEIFGFNIIKEDDKTVNIKMGAGEIWDQVVEKTVELGFSGLEALSAIPGTVGATPVQNVGAYGVEVKDTILEVEVFDIEKGITKKLSNEECKFGYRDSIFKNVAKGKYIIISVTYSLSKLPPKIPQYPDTIKYFNERNIAYPRLKEIRQALIEIRWNKLPNPKDTPNTGSFFKNPMVLKEVVEKILKDFPEAKIFRIDDNLFKIPAGWLIDNAGLKGKAFGNISIYDKNALVLVNNGGASFQDLINARNEIVKTIEDKFGIILEQEPEII